MTEKVTVALRIRPPLTVDEEKSICIVPLDEHRVCVGDKRVFSVDDVFDFLCDSSFICKKRVQPLIDSFLEGYNATVMAYGQSGTGKTYTMSSLAPMIIEEVATRMGSTEHLSFQLLEVYGEVLHDLLAADGNVTKPLQLLDGQTQTHVVGASRVRVRSLEEAQLLLEHGNTMRATGATSMNANSSRSHSILTIFNHEKLSKFHIVDLAGSERNKKTHNVGVRFKESVGINTGLLALGNVIRSLAQGQHIPYRASKLTRLLQDSLGGNSRTLFVACVAPDMANMDETVRTLQYSCKAMQILNEPLPNLDLLQAQQQKHLRRLQNAHNLSSDEHLKTYADHDAFAAEQAAEIQRLTALVNELERDLRAAKLELKKDEVIFAKQLKELRMATQENQTLKERVSQLEQVRATPVGVPRAGGPAPSTVLSTVNPTPLNVTAADFMNLYSFATNHSDTPSHVTKDVTTQRRGALHSTPLTNVHPVVPVAQPTPTPNRKLHIDAVESLCAATSAMAQKLEQLDDVRMATWGTPPPSSPPRRATNVQLFPPSGTATPALSTIYPESSIPFQAAEQLHDAVKETLFLQQTNVKLRTKLDAVLQQNDILTEDNRSLRKELNNIRDMLNF